MVPGSDILLLYLPRPAALPLLCRNSPAAEAVCGFLSEAVQLLLRRPHELHETQQELLAAAGLDTAGSGSGAPSPPQFSLLALCALRQLLRVLPSIKMASGDKAGIAAYVAGVLRQLAQQQLGGDATAAAALPVVLLGVTAQQAAWKQQAAAPGDGAASAAASTSSKKKRKMVEAEAGASSGQQPLELPAEGAPLLSLFADLQQQQQQHLLQQTRSAKKQKKQGSKPLAVAVAVIGGGDGEKAALQEAEERDMSNGCLPLISRLAAAASASADSSSGSDGSAELLADIQQSLADCASDDAGDDDSGSGVGLRSAVVRQCLHHLQREPATAVPLMAALHAAVLSAAATAAVPPGGGLPAELRRCLQLLAGSSLVALALGGSEAHAVAAEGLVQLLHELLTGHSAASSCVSGLELLQLVADAFQRQVAAAAAAACAPAPAVARHFLLLLPHLSAAALAVAGVTLLDALAAPASSQLPPWVATAAAAVVQLQAHRGCLQPDQLGWASGLLLQLAGAGDASDSSDSGSSAAVLGTLLQLLAGGQRAATLAALGSAGQAQLLRRCLCQEVVAAGGTGGTGGTSMVACSGIAALLVQEGGAECRELAAELLPELLQRGSSCSGSAAAALALALALPVAAAYLETEQQQQEATRPGEAVLAALSQALLDYLSPRIGKQLEQQGTEEEGERKAKKAKRHSSKKHGAEAPWPALLAAAAQLLQEHALPCLRLLLRAQPLPAKRRKQLLAALLPEAGWQVAGGPGSSGGGDVSGSAGLSPGPGMAAEAAVLVLLQGGSPDACGIAKLASCVRCFAATLATLLK